MTSRADQHDIDKLGRWCRDLAEPSGNSYPLCAVFLVSEVDRTAHDIFRAFRSSFEQRDAGFGNLVIFGQHGVSSTVRMLLSRLGLPPGSMPLLLLLPSAGGRSLYLLPLPAGSASRTGIQRLPDTPLDLLARVEEFADRAIEARSNQARSNEARSNQARSNEARSNQARSNQARSNEARSNQARSNEARSNQARSNQARSNEARSNEAFDVAGVSGLTQVPLPAADLITLVRQLVGEE
jgi:hypothetical protein